MTASYTTVTVTPAEPGEARIVGTYGGRPIATFVVGDVTVNLGAHPDPAEWLRMAAASMESLAVRYEAATAVAS